MNFGFQNLPYLGATVHFSGDTSWRTQLAPGLYVVKTLAPLRQGEKPYYPNSGTYFGYNFAGDKTYPSCLTSHPYTYHKSNPSVKEFGYTSSELYYGTSIHSNDVRSVLHPLQKAKNALWPFDFTVPSSIPSTNWSSSTALRLGLPNSHWYWNPLVSWQTSSPYKTLTEEHKFIDATDPSSAALPSVAPSFGHYLLLSRLTHGYKNSYQLFFKPDEDVNADACYLKFVNAEEDHDLKNIYCGRTERNICLSNFTEIYVGEECHTQTQIEFRGPSLDQFITQWPRQWIDNQPAGVNWFRDAAIKLDDYTCVTNVNPQLGPIKKWDGKTSYPTYAAGPVFDEAAATTPPQNSCGPFGYPHNCDTYTLPNPVSSRKTIEPKFNCWEWGETGVDGTYCTQLPYNPNDPTLIRPYATKCYEYSENPHCRDH